MSTRNTATASARKQPLPPRTRRAVPVQATAPASAQQAPHEPAAPVHEPAANGKPVHPPSYQPGTPGFVERRKNWDRRATDNPVVDTDKLAAAVEGKVRDFVDRAVHRGIQAAMREAVGLVLPQRTNDANMAPMPAPVTANTATDEKEPPVVRNGVRCPEYGTVTGQLWLLYGKAGAGVTLTQAKQLAKENGLNEASAAIALYNWRKFHGVKSPKQG